MELQFRGKVGGVGFVRGVKKAEKEPLPVGPNLRSPTLIGLVPRNAEKSRGVVLLRSQLILLIRGLRYVTQVCYPVIGPVAIDVIDLLLRPRAVGVEPSQSMSHEGRPVDHDADVAAAVDRSRDSARFG